MTVELGLNLAGVERVLALEAELAAARERVAALDRRPRRLAAEVRRLAALRRGLRADLVPHERGGRLCGRAEPGRSAHGIMERLAPVPGRAVTRLGVVAVRRPYASLGPLTASKRKLSSPSGSWLTGFVLAPY